MNKTSSEKSAQEFIDFLLSEGVLDKEKAESVLTIWKTRLMFGIVALREAFITPDQLVYVLQEQQLAGGPEAGKIGQLLINRGIMTQEQVDAVLELQKKGNNIPAEALLDTGILPHGILMEKYRKFTSQDSPGQ